MCDEARGRVYKGGPLPLWTTRRHHIITNEKLTQSYLVVTCSRRFVRHACSQLEWNCHLGGSSQSLWAKVPWTCLHSIIQHYLGSLQDPPLHKNCFILSLHENKFFGFEREWPCRRQLPTETSPKAVLEGRVLIWTSTERGEGRSIAGSTLVLAQGPRTLWWRLTHVCSSVTPGL